MTFPAGPMQRRTPFSVTPLLPGTEPLLRASGSNRQAARSLDLAAFSYLPRRPDLSSLECERIFACHSPQDSPIVSFEQRRSQGGVKFSTGGIGGFLRLSPRAPSGFRFGRDKQIR
ncbi:Hypothetical protein GOX0977 [Gluconobacter oxydans 621H]|uniref:Uncharacterized protein n=1 Tax=Gluconobacter oxydans (strain 621H) TaxID=290633 RepID=Q5FS97_GLUOX|nr:Hypothetical protein GOX0977 [Gluconobacter oxydans 621H]